MCRACVCERVLKAPLCVPWAVLTLPPCVVVVCVLNTCSPYPCHSGHRIAVHRRLPGVAQLAAQEHQEHELRQPSLPQNHGGRRRRDPHRPTQRLRRPYLPGSEWQPQSAIHSATSRGRCHRQQLSLVLGGADAVQRKMRGSAAERKEVEEESLGVWKSVFGVRRRSGVDRRTSSHTHTQVHVFVHASPSPSHHVHLIYLLHQSVKQSSVPLKLYLEFCNLYAWRSVCLTFGDRY